MDFHVNTAITGPSLLATTTASLSPNLDLVPTSQTVADDWLLDFINTDRIDFGCDLNAVRPTPILASTEFYNTDVIPSRTTTGDTWTPYPSSRVQEQVQKAYPTLESTPSSSRDNILRGEMWSAEYFPQDLFTTEGSSLHDKGIAHELRSIRNELEELSDGLVHQSTTIQSAGWVRLNHVLDRVSVPITRSQGQN